MVSRQPPLRDTNVTAVGLSSGGKRLAIGRTDGSVALWVREDQVWREASGFKVDKHVWSIVFSPDGRRCAACGGNMVSVWDVPRQALRDRFIHTDAATLMFSPDSKLLACGATHGSVKLWELDLPHRTREVWGHDAFVANLAFFPDGKTLVTGSHDMKAKLWDIPSLRLRATLQGQSEGANAVAVSPDENRVVVGTGEGLVTLWIPGGEHPMPVVTLRGHLPFMRAVGFVDSNTIVSASLTELRLWWAPSFEQLELLESKRGKSP